MRLLLNLQEPPRACAKAILLRTCCCRCCNVPLRCALHTHSRSAYLPFLSEYFSIFNTFFKKILSARVIRCMIFTSSTRVLRQTLPHTLLHHSFPGATSCAARTHCRKRQRATLPDRRRRKQRQVPGADHKCTFS